MGNANPLKYMHFIIVICGCLFVEETWSSRDDLTYARAMTVPKAQVIRAINQENSVKHGIVAPSPLRTAQNTQEKLEEYYKLIQGLRFEKNFSDAQLKNLQQKFEELREELSNAYVETFLPAEIRKEPSEGTLKPRKLDFGSEPAAEDSQANVFERLSSIKVEIANLKGENETLQEELLRLKKSLDQSNGLNTSLRSENDALKQEISRLEAQHQEVLKQIGLLQKENDSCTAELLKTQGLVKQLNLSNSDWVIKIAKLQQQNLQLESSNNDLVKLSDRFQKEMLAEQQAHAELLTSNTTLLSDKGVLLQEKKSLVERLDSLQGQIDSLNLEKKNSQANYDSLKQQLQKKIQRTDEEAAEKKSLSERLDSKQVLVDALTLEKANLQANYDLLKQQLQEQIIRSDEDAVEKESLKHKLSNIENENISLINALASLKDKRDVLKQLPTGDNALKFSRKPAGTDEEIKFTNCFSPGHKENLAENGKFPVSNNSDLVRILMNTVQELVESGKDKDSKITALQKKIAGLQKRA